MWFAYIHCLATVVFSMSPPRDYMSGTEPNEIKESGESREREREEREREERERERMRTGMERVLGSHLL
jgi:hypothetical protein